jgi:dihydroorotase
VQSIIIKNGEVIDPESGVHDILDVFIQGGKISKIGKSIESRADVVLEAEGMVVSPGFIDLRAHLCDPGFTRREDIGSGSRSGAAGGFTTVVVRPDTNPVVDNSALVYYIMAKAKETACIRVLPSATVTQGMKGDMISPLGSLKSAGVVLLSNGIQPITDAEVMRRAMAFNRTFQLPFSLHCEEPSLSRGGLVKEGNTAVRLGVKGIPETAETVMMSRDILLAEANETKLHINHIGSKSAIDLIRAAKARGGNVTCNVTPYHFYLLDRDIQDFDPNLKFLPPLGSETDVKAIKEGLKDGAIDAIISDHSPWTPEEKDIEFDQASFGAIGLEVAFALSYSELVVNEILSIDELLRKFTVNPAKILGLDLGRLQEGAEADIVLIDPKVEWVVEPDKFESRASNTPLRGKTLKGRPSATIVKGQIVMREGKIQEGALPFK